MTFSKFIGILAFISQFGNMGLVYLQTWSPETAIYVSVALATIQAFTKAVNEKFNDERF